ncbi:MAG: phosphate ABC transporter substrate-binding protein [Ruminococcaceae bacterium]|nr:phosphate ABC transporter substrate-binding protein [Oscillospiraceae bacterium]
MKKLISGLLVTGLAAALLAGCGSTPSSSSSAQQPSQPASIPAASAPSANNTNFDTTVPLTIVTREDGSGTRGAFVELLGIEEKQEDGTKIDRTTPDAPTVNSTSVVMTTVAGDPYAIGYISLGSLNDTVKALEIDGVAPTVATIKDGSYTVARPFNIATKAGLSASAQDFIGYILSTEGQAVVAASGYIPLDDTAGYAGVGATEKVVVAGSSSVTPVMEKLKEAYVALNPGAEIEIQQSDSSTGMSATTDGICDIGMASRELKDSELEAGLTPTVIAMDGIAVIVNNDNPTTGLTSEQVKNIYIGDVATWADLA